MPTKRKTQKQIREEQQRTALRQRLIDMTNGAGSGDVECGSVGGDIRTGSGDVCHR